VAYESAAARGETAAARVAAKPSRYVEVDVLAVSQVAARAAALAATGRYVEETPLKLHRSQRPIVRLGTDLIGYCMHPERLDECFRAALATATQIPLEEVPDARIDARLAAGDDSDQIIREAWEDLDDWLLARGLQLAVHETLPVGRERWIGVCSASGHACFSEHCLVLRYGEIILDPGIGLEPGPGMQLRTWIPSDIDYGFTLDRKE